MQNINQVFRFVVLGNGSYELPFEGDIELTPKEENQLTGNKTDGLRMRRNVITAKYKGGDLWPNGVVYYAVANNLGKNMLCISNIDTKY